MNAGRKVRWRPLAVLGAVVLAVHWLILMAASGSLHIAPPAQTHALVTRTIQPLPPPAPPASPAADTGHMRAAASVLLQPPALQPPQGTQVTPPEQTASVSSALASAPPSLPATPALVPPPPSDTSVAEATRPAHESMGQPTSFAIPDSVKLVYQVTARSRQMDWHAKAELVWKRDAEFYEATLELSAPLFPSRKQRSTGRIGQEGLMPSRFSDKTRSEEAAHFQRDKGKITFSTNQPEAPLLAGAQDRLSILIQLAAMIGSAPQRFPAATTIEIQTASTREAQMWLFTVGEVEQLELPGGKLAALRLIRNPRREFDQKVELWLAPGMDYAPVRLRLTQPNGDWVDQQWSFTDRV